ncbi:hypothetical protein V6N13_064352 [Hibiscus sabdariffa]|uniref:Uncharacterized protein n=1 Tax=Hibiscus sabdariffa TaxID=183260 RepID=A0ABR2EDC7_9ROSI
MNDGELHNKVLLEKSDGNTSKGGEEVALQTVDVAATDTVIPVPMSLNSSANKAIRVVEVRDVRDTIESATSIEELLVVKGDMGKEVLWRNNEAFGDDGSL